MTPFEYIFWSIVAGLLILGPPACIGVFVALRKRMPGVGVIVATSVAVIVGAVCTSSVALESDSAQLYTRTLGVPQSLQIEHLQFLNGPFGSTDQVQIWTDQGVYLLRAGAPIPYTGTVYRIDKLKPWSKTPRAFICLDTRLDQCWQTLLTTSS